MHCILNSTLTLVQQTGQLTFSIKLVRKGNLLQYCHPCLSYHASGYCTIFLLHSCKYIGEIELERVLGCHHMARELWAHVMMILSTCWAHFFIHAGHIFEMPLLRGYLYLRYNIIL